MITKLQVTATSRLLRQRIDELEQKCADLEADLGRFDQKRVRSKLQFVQQTLLTNKHFLNLLSSKSLT